MNRGTENRRANPEPGGQADPAAGVTLRRLPYPYRAAFTIANDIDGTSWQDFLGIYRLLCGQDGPGLALSSSFFLFPHKNQAENFSYFKDLSCQAGPQRRQIERLVKAGYLDTIHGFGDFAKGRPFLREHAQSAYRALSERGLTLKVWTSHGDLHNRQQIDSSGEVEEADGDRAGSDAYHLDLSLAYGVRYFWQWAGTGLSALIGQSPLDYPAFGGKLLVARAGGGPSKDYAFVDTDPASLAELREQNALLAPAAMKDSSRVYLLRRFVLDPALRCLSDNLKHQIRPDYINELIQNQGHMVLYQHLGRRLTPSREALEANKPPYFDDETLELLRNLAFLQRGGALWVAPLRELLDYHYLARHLRAKARLEGETLLVELAGPEDEHLSRPFEIDRGDLQGLSIYTPRPERTVVSWSGREIKGLVANPADHTGRPSVTLPRAEREPFV